MESSKKNCRSVICTVVTWTALLSANQNRVIFSCILLCNVTASFDIIFYLLFFRVAPALLRQATYGSLKLGFYHALKRRLVKDPKGKYRSMECFAIYRLWCLQLLNCIWFWIQLSLIKARWPTISQWQSLFIVEWNSRNITTCFDPSLWLDSLITLMIILICSFFQNRWDIVLQCNCWNCGWCSSCSHLQSNWPPEGK